MLRQPKCEACHVPSCVLLNTYSWCGVYVQPCIFCQFTFLKRNIMGLTELPGWVCACVHLKFCALLDRFFRNLIYIHAIPKPCISITCKQPKDYSGHKTCVVGKIVFYSMAQHSLVGQGLFIIEASRSHSDTPYSVGLLWTSDQPDAETSTWQHMTFTRDRLLCPRWNPNPQSQQERSRRPKP
jgi:hypothetical protein